MSKTNYKKLKKPEDCTIEELIHSLTWHANTNQLQIISGPSLTSKDGFMITSYNRQVIGRGDTIKEALIDYGIRHELTYPTPTQYVNNEYDIIDWRF